MEQASWDSFWSLYSWRLTNGSTRNRQAGEDTGPLSDATYGDMSGLCPYYIVLTLFDANLKYNISPSLHILKLTNTLMLIQLASIHVDGKQVCILLFIAYIHISPSPLR